MRCARAVHDASRGAEFGFRLDAPPQADFGSVMDRVRKMRSLSSSDPVAPAIEGLRTGGYLTNETVFSLTGLPARLVVIGGGPLGCELAQAFRRLASEVDLVSHPGTLLPR
jgi:NADPH-dependent 2,4-dienoyl-CoA reductase/sulfur reductase-like enzyme